MRVVHYYTDNDDRIFGKKVIVFDSTIGQFAVVDRDDEIYAAGGNDTIFSLGGDDVIHAGSGSDSVNAGDGNDTIHGDEGQDTIFGGDGHDYINAGTDGGMIMGGDGNDTINGADYGVGGLNNAYFIDGGDDDDKIIGGRGSDTIHGGTGNDTLYITTGQDLMSGGEGNDIFIVEAPTANQGYQLHPFEVFVGGAGYDTLDLRAADGDQEVYTWNFGPTIAGVSEIERILTGSGDDEINNPLGAQYIDAGWGNDTVTAGDQAQSLFGGADEDTLILQTALGSQTGVTLYTDEGRSDNAYIGGASAHYIRGFENYTLTGSNDRFYGAGKDEMVELGAGNDIAYGSAGNDDLRGGIGADFLNGGVGNDTLAGGIGADEFYFDIDKPFGSDVITDFDTSDRITFDQNGAYAGRLVIKNDDGDAILSFLGLLGSSITVIGGAGLVSSENIDFVGGFKPLDIGDFQF